jgi:hypothetical protein
LNGFLLPLLCSSSCDSTNCVYILKCKRCCNTFYIGETSSFRRRFLQHCNDIKKFIPYYVYTSVSIHFNLKGHNLNNDIAFFIFDSNLNNNTYRFNVESQLINLFKDLKMKLINSDITDKYNLMFNSI